MRKKSLLWGIVGIFIKNPGVLSAGLVRFGKVTALGAIGALITAPFWHEGLTDFGYLILIVALLGGLEKFLKEKWGAGLALAFALLLAQPAKAQKIQVKPTQIAIGGGAMIGGDGVIASWDAVFGAIQWHGVQFAGESASTGVGIEIHPAAVFQQREGNTFLQSIEAVDWRLWSMNRLKLSTLQLPGEVWDKMFIGTDLLIQEGGSKDFTGDFTARLVYALHEDAGPGKLEVEIYMFEKYRPVSFAVLYRYDF